LTDLNNFANILQGEILEIKEIEEFVGRLAKERGISDLHVSQCSKGIRFSLILESVLNIECDAPHKTKGSYLLVGDVEKIAKPHKWSVSVERYSPEDDPSRIDIWCEANKILTEPVNKEKVIATVNEAAEILKKLNEILAKKK
jgi:hypothetical protein